MTENEEEEKRNSGECARSGIQTCFSKKGRARIRREKKKGTDSLAMMASFSRCSFFATRFFAPMTTCLTELTTAWIDVIIYKKDKKEEEKKKKEERVSNKRFLGMRRAEGCQNT